MKSAKVFLGVALIFGLVFVVRAADEGKGGKEQTLKGELVCAKCTLMQTDKCTNALKVKEGDKEVIYYLDDKGRGESYHKAICPPNSSKKASVTGVVSEKEGQKYIKPKAGGVKLTEGPTKKSDE
jgi:hypothetical protein